TARLSSEKFRFFPQDSLRSGVLAPISTVRSPVFRLVSPGSPRSFPPSQKRSMSLHAQLSPEAQARLNAQRRNSTITSIIISILIIVLVGLILAFILLPALVQETPTIVSYPGTAVTDENLEMKKVTNTVTRKPSAPSSAMSKVIAAATTSNTAVPVPEIDVPVLSAEFGNGDDFGDGWGSGG